MTRRLWLAILWSSAVLGLLPGCKHLLDGCGIWSVAPPIAGRDDRRPPDDLASGGGRNDSLAQFVIEDPPNPFEDEKEFPPSVLVKRGGQHSAGDVPASPAWLPKIPQFANPSDLTGERAGKEKLSTDRRGSPDPANQIGNRRLGYPDGVNVSRRSDELPPWLRQPLPAETDPPEPKRSPGPALPPAPMEAPTAALHLFLLNRHDEALKKLKDFDPDRQEFFLRLLPVIAQLNRKKLEQLNQQEIGVLFEQLEGLLGALRRRAKLVVEQMCFCETIDGFGTYQALPPNHSFRAKRNGHPGELAQLYVQLRNLSSERRGGYYETCISSSVRIKDKSGREWWYFDFQDRDTPTLSRAPRHDFFRNYRFQVPSLPPGDYLLTLEIKDVTRAEAIRSASRSLPFRVGE